MNQTETKLLERIDNSPHKQTVVIHGYRTNRKSGRFGCREFNAMISLRDKGIIKILKSHKNQDCRQTYTDNWSECVIARSQ